MYTKYLFADRVMHISHLFREKFLVYSKKEFLIKKKSDTFSQYELTLICFRISTVIHHAAGCVHNVKKTR